jgi:nicotinate-nucleotide pyrophosphorylase (carboxylating)
MFSHALPPHWRSLAESWLREDSPSLDIGGYVVGDSPATAILYMKSSGVLAGVPFFNAVFDILGCTVEWKELEGTCIQISGKQRTSIAKVSGPVKNILLGERCALNALARASGIATRATELNKLKSTNRWKGIIAGTRKTTPGFRVVEKYALIVGGVDTHRYDLSSMVMLKDNHIWASGSIEGAIKKAKEVAGFSVKIEVEVSSYEDAAKAILAGADIVMLDNFNPKDLAECAKRLKSEFNKSPFLIEGSGGLTVENAPDYFSECMSYTKLVDVDILSFGSLTQGVPHVDFSLKIQV